MLLSEIIGKLRNEGSRFNTFDIPVKYNGVEFNIDAITEKDENGCYYINLVDK